MLFYIIEARGQGHSCQKWYATISINLMHPHKIWYCRHKNAGDMLRIWFYQVLGLEVKITVTLNSMQHSSTPICIPIWDFYVIKFRKYAPYTILKDQSQRSRSQWPQNSRLHEQHKNASKTRNLLRYARDTIILGWLRQEVKVKVTQKMLHNTLNSKIHRHTEFEIPTFNSKVGSSRHDVRTQSLRMNSILKIN